MNRDDGVAIYDGALRESQGSRQAETPNGYISFYDIILLRFSPLSHHQLAQHNQSVEIRRRLDVSDLLWASPV